LTDKFVVVHGVASITEIATGRAKRRDHSHEAVAVAVTG
jgi:hypothetical protein